MKKTSYILAVSLLACSAEALDVGEDASPDTASGGTGSSGAQDAAAVAAIPHWTEVGACPTTGIDAPQFVGAWEGALEDYYLSPVLPIRLVITKATSDGVCGTLSWDTTTTPPLPLTDPSQSGAEFGYGGGPSEPIPGLSYTISKGAARDEALRFGVPVLEPWRGFCEMQTELYYTPRMNAYSCLEPHDGMGFTHPAESRDPGDTCFITTPSGNVEKALKQCVGCDFFVCLCNAEACAANIERTYDFDLQLDRSGEGDQLLVSAQELSGRQAMRLQRVP